MAETGAAEPLTQPIGWLSDEAVSVADGDDWLTPAERAVQEGLVVPKRRCDWRLGRWTAKHAVARWLATGGRPDELAAVGELPALHEIEVLAGPGGAPEVTVRGRPGPALSISHRDGRGVAAVTGPGGRIGCDLERAEARSPAFVRDWFTPAEVRAVDAAGAEGRALAVARTWAAKESALKAIGEGLRLDTRDVEVQRLAAGAETADGWSPVAVAWSRSGQVFRGAWRVDGEWVLVVLVDGSGVATPWAL